MRGFTQLAALSLLGLATASDVVQLKKETFNDFVGDNKLVLAECEFPSQPCLREFGCSDCALALGLEINSSHAITIT
jgi:hypothetical protein